MGERTLSAQNQIAHSGSRGLNTLRLLTFWVAICVSSAGSFAAQVFKEYDLKALFLYNFPQFVDWPADTFASPTTPLVIGVLGQDRFGKSLDDLTRTDSANSRIGGTARKIKIERSRRFTDLQNCHILFIDQSESANLDEIFRKCCGKPILTVSDMEGFTRRGGMIQFITDEKEKKIRLRINNSSAKDAHLAISSKLLKLAQPE